MAKEKSGKSSEEPKPERKKTPAKSTKSASASSAAKKATPAKAKAAKPKAAPKAKAPAKGSGAASKAAAPAKSGAKKAPAGKKPAAKKPAATKATPKASPKKAGAKAAAATSPTARTAKVRAAAASAPDEALREEYRRIEEDPRELPLDYGETKVVLLTRDPEWIFAYWEMSPATRAEFGLTRGQHQKTLTLRAFDLETGRPGHGAAYFDVSVNDYTSSWYIRVPRPGTTYLVQLGLLEEDRFRPIASSNPLHIPRRGIAEEADVQFAEINDEVYEQIVHLSGGVRISERLGSDDFLRSLQQRVFAGLTDGPYSSAGLSSGIFHGLSSGLLGGSSEAYSSGQFFSDLSSGMLTGGAGEEALRTRAAGPDREFWLEAGVDVIVYGATEPDARVTFMGQEIRLTPDGTFRVRMVLPDSTIEFPIEARSADGAERRFVKPVVSRQTEGDPRKPS